MTRVHVVGKEGSFTHIASLGRYPNSKDFGFGHKPKDFVDELLQKRIPPHESAVIPFWNSNRGDIRFDKSSPPVRILLSGSTKVVDVIWNRIRFALGVKDVEYKSGGKIYSVNVAPEQCSVFLRDKNIPINGRFVDTTTEACDLFLSEGIPGDCVLCSNELIQQKKLKLIKEDVANPYNTTIFLTVNLLPEPVERSGKYSLGTFSMDMSGDELPLGFVDYYRELANPKDLVDSDNVMEEIPRIVFVLRYEESKALALLEMKLKDDSSNPWTKPEFESHIGSCVEVGQISNSFASGLSHHWATDFTASTSDTIFYKGTTGICFWSCDPLGVSIQGFNKELVKQSALVQVDYMKYLRDYGVQFPPNVQRILSEFATNPAGLKLADISEPETPA